MANSHSLRNFFERGMGAGKYNKGAHIAQTILGSTGFKLLRRRRWALRVFLGSCDPVKPEMDGRDHV